MSLTQSQEIQEIADEINVEYYGDESNSASGSYYGYYGYYGYYYGYGYGYEYGDGEEDSSGTHHPTKAPTVQRSFAPFILTTNVPFARPSQHHYSHHPTHYSQRPTQYHYSHRPTLTPSLISPSASRSSSGAPTSPTYSPSSRYPTRYPTRSPTTKYAPTPYPTKSQPTRYPTIAPSSPTSDPTFIPSPPPSVTPTFLPSFSPTTLSPTSFPTNQTANPTLSPTESPTTSPTLTPSASPSVAPTESPSLQPIVVTDSPTSSPTAPVNIWQLSFPKMFSRDMDSLLLNFTLIVILATIGLLFYVIVSGYFNRKWSFSSLYSRVILGENEMDTTQSAISLTSTGGKGNGPIRKKIVKNKYEDYWGEDSEDNSLRNFPTRASTMGLGLGYGSAAHSGTGLFGSNLGMSTLGGKPTQPKPKGTVSYEDYWDENIDFSIRSHDSFGLK